MTITVALDDTEMADLYEAAADYIEAHGWARGEFRTRAGEVCVSGAICAAAIANAAETRLSGVNRWQAAMDRLAKATLPYHPVTWNDTIATDEFEVIDLLRNTAKEVRNAH